MSAVASIEWDHVAAEIELAERSLDELFTFAERLHRANIQHNPHSCLLCFEKR